MTGLKKRLAAGLVAFWMLFSLLSLTPVADTARAPPGQTAPFDVEAVAGEAFHVKDRHLFRHFGAEGSGTAEAEAYRGPENNYAKDGSGTDPRYCLVTTDPERAETDGGSTLLTYDDPDNPGSVREYAVSVRYIDITQPGAKALLTGFEELKGENTTIFLEGGPFYAGGSLQPDEVSRFFDFYDNFSVVGINRTGNVAVCSQPGSALQPGEAGYIRGYQLGNAQNVCIQNITFDAKGSDMDPQSSGTGVLNGPDGDSRYIHTFFRVNSSTNTGLGECSSVDGLVMKNVSIQNLGAGASAGDAEPENIALGIGYGRSKMHFENLSFKNIISDFAVMTLTAVSDVNFRDVTFEDCTQGQALIHYGMSSGERIYVPEQEMGAVFAGELQVIKDGEATAGSDRIFRCDALQAGALLVPDTVRYAETGELSYAFRQPPEKATTFYDIQQGSFIIRPGDGGTLDTTQLREAIAVLHEKRGLSEAVLVKLSANADGEIPSVDPLCSLWASPEAGDVTDVTVVMAAVRHFEDACDSGTLVPVTADFRIAPDTGMSGGDPGYALQMPVTQKLYFCNLDFAKNAGYTLQEAVKGIDPAALAILDPLDGSYRDVSLNAAGYVPAAAVPPSVLDIDASAFQNCRFTVLADGLVTNVMSLPAWNTEKNALVVNTGDSAAVTPAFTGFGAEDAGTWLTAAEFTEMDGDADVYWESSDPSVAGVFFEDGVLQVTGISEGTAAVFGKARDCRNQGETEKPYTVFSVEVTSKSVLAAEQYSVSYHANGGEGSLKALNNPYSAGVAVTVLAPEGKITAKDGALFQGWNTRPDGKGESYQPGGSFIINAHVDLYAQWYTLEAEEPLLPEGAYELNTGGHSAYLMGYPDGTIRPGGHVSREEAAVIFFRLLSEETREKMLGTENAYADMAAGRWSGTAVSTLSQMGIIKGYEGGLFHPEKKITRAEFAVFASRFDTRELSDLPGFADTREHWAKSEIGRVVALGWIEGYPGGSFRPDDYITRAEVARTVNRMLQRGVRNAEALTADMTVWPDNTDSGKWYYFDLQEATNSHTYERISDDGNAEVWTGIEQGPAWEEYE